MIVIKNKTTVTGSLEGLRATRIIASKLRSISTTLPDASIDYISMVNRLTDLDNDDFMLLRDLTKAEIVQLENYR